jgi:hypothetical protein
VALPPITPFTCHVTAVLLVFCTVAENCCVPPAATVADVGEIVTLTALAAVIVTGAEADFVVSAWDTAVTVTVAGLGTAAGPVYKPEPEIVPTVALPPITPFTCHVTAVLLVFCTVAENCCVRPAVTIAEVGEIVTPTGIGCRVVATPAQPKDPSTLIPTAMRIAQNVCRFTLFLLQPRLLVFIVFLSRV